MLRNHFNLLINVCVCVPYVGNGSLFLLFGLQGSNSGHQVWPQVTLLIEPSGQPLTWAFEHCWNVRTLGPLKEGQSVFSTVIETKDFGDKRFLGTKIILWSMWRILHWEKKTYVLKILASIWWNSGNLQQ